MNSIEAFCLSQSYLNSRLWQGDLQSDLLTHENIRVACLSKERLEYVQLGSCEGGPLSPLLSRRLVRPVRGDGAWEEANSDEAREGEEEKK